MCETVLVREPEVDGDSHAIVGEECHVIARSPGGPRGGPGLPDDSYDNLILLCATCHTVVDMQATKYTSDALRTMKTQHEQRVARRAVPRSFAWTLRGHDKPVRLNLIENGDQLVRLICPAIRTRSTSRTA
jgi:hypothetical protein